MNCTMPHMIFSQGEESNTIQAEELLRCQKLLNCAVNVIINSFLFNLIY